MFVRPDRRGVVEDALHPVEVLLQSRNGTPIVAAEHVLDERTR
jgi:hypothetical protein